MGIKDKVLDILFDDDNDEQENINHQEKENCEVYHQAGRRW